MITNTNRIMQNAYSEYWRYTSEAAFAKDTNGVYIDASQAYVEAIGCKSREDIIGKTDFEIFEDQELAKRYRDDDAKVLAENISLEGYVEPTISKNGRPRYCITSKYVLRDDEGNTIGLLGFFRDITNEYEARQNYESELAKLFEMPDDALITIMFDVTSWRVVDTRSRDNANHIISTYNTVDEYIENAAVQVAEGEEARKFFENASQRFFLNEYNSGKRNTSFEYLRTMGDGTARWVRSEFHYLNDPVNGNLSIIMTMRDIHEYKTDYSELVRAAKRDSMTGLLNRKAIEKSISDHLSEAVGLQALFMIDLDNFKQINDTFGHQCGDNVLMEAAEAIKNTFRNTDIIGRIGGDEFMVLMKNVSSRDVVLAKADELIESLQFSSNHYGRSFDLTTSVGITVFTAGEADFNSLYSEADSALYGSKKNGKNQYSIYESGRETGSQGEPSPILQNVNTVQLRTLLDYMDGGVVLAEVSDDISITYVSPSLYSTFGWTAEKIGGGGESIMSVILPEDLDGFREAIFKAAESGDILDYSYRVDTEEGIKWRHIRAKRIPERGDGVHRLVSVITDITDITHTNDQLREAQERYQTALEQTSAMMWEVDVLSRTMMLTSPVWQQYHQGTTIFTDAPASYLATGIIHPDSVAEFGQMFCDIYEGVENRGYYLKGYIADGQECWVKAQFKLMRNEKGEPYRALGITQPVPNINTEMHHFEQETQFAHIVKDSLLGYIRFNLTQDKVEDAEIKGSDRYKQYIGLDCNSYYRTAVKEFVHEDDIQQFEPNNARGYLIERFRERQNWKFMDYRRLCADGSYRWTSVFIKLIRHPISGDVYAFYYLRDNQNHRSWELELGIPLRRNSTLLLYTHDSMELLTDYIIETSSKDAVMAMSVIEIIGLNKIKDESGVQAVSELLFTFGRLCRIAITGDVIIGQMDEDKIALFRADAGSNALQKERVTKTMTVLKKLLSEAHPEARVELIGGFTVDEAGRASYERLLRKADIACKSAAKTLGESAVAYTDTGVEVLADEDELTINEKYHALELRYQQQANMLHGSENDELTGIFGKQAFYRHVRETLDGNPGNKYAIMRFDINRFKVFNDVCGIRAGDLLLCDIAQKLRQYEGQVIQYARLDSDHFALLVPDDIHIVEQAKHEFEKWLAEYSFDFRLSFTVGVYKISDPSVDVSLMCDRALLALKSVKSAFDTKMAYYDDALRDMLLDEQQLVSDMEEALEEDQFEIYFQPQINYENGMPIGAEALVRWNHPQRGLLSPSQFIPLFEKNGLITRLDEYVWDRCCRYVRRWIDRYPQSNGFSISISVNVSRLDIYDPKLCDTFKNIVSKYGLPTSALRLEITESAYMENPQQLIDMVNELQRNGFVVEMDDFGSGYSSLNTLKDVCVDVLKLDMKFLEDCKDSSRGGNILNSVIRMAHWLKLPIIAEGIETKEQANYLKSLGCLYMQGYYFWKPMKAEAFEELLAGGAVSWSDKYKDTSIEGMAAFWDASAQTALLFNSFVGGAAIMEYREGVLEASRVNDNFYKTMGTTREEFMTVQTALLSCFDDENKERVLTKVQQAIDTTEECGFEIKYKLGVGGITRLWNYVRMRLLAKNNQYAILYVSIEDITERKHMEQEQQIESERNRLLMQTTGTAFFDYDFASDTLKYQLYLPDAGVKKCMVSECIKNRFRNTSLHPQSAEEMMSIIESAMTSHTDGEIEFRADLWERGMNWCRLWYSSVEDARGKVYRMVGQVDDIQEIKEREALVETIRRRLNAQTQEYIFNDDIVSQVFELFYNSSDVEDAIDKTFSIIGEQYDLSRIYVFEDTEDHTATKNIFEWCGDGVEPKRDALEYLPYEKLGGRQKYLDCFDHRGNFYCPDVKLLSSSARKRLEPQGVFAMLQCAIKDNEEYLGFIGFDECREDYHWTDEQIGTMMFISRIVSLFLQRMRNFDNVAFSTDFRAALDDNAAFVYIIDPQTYEIIYSNKAIRSDSGQDFIGDICYKEFIGLSKPCYQCPIKNMNEEGRNRATEIVRADGMILLSQASPLRWNGRDMVMISCTDITDIKQQK